MSRVLTILLVFSCSILIAQQAEFSYVGAKSCGLGKICHKNDEKGNQFGKWSEGVHARAFETLKGEEALKMAKEQGLEAAPHEAGECLTCHATGLGKAGGYEVLSADFIANPENAKAVKKNNSKANVGCESCHGPGSKYKSKKTMEGIFSGAIDPATVGLIKPDKAVCITCHNEKSPTFKEFDFDARVPDIAHAYPEEFKATKGTSGEK